MFGLKNHALFKIIVLLFLNCFIPSSIAEEDPANKPKTELELRFGLGQRYYPNRNSFFRGNTNLVQFDEYSVKDFYKIVYESEQIWIILFYAHWCTHSERFAPTVWHVAHHIFKEENTWGNIINFGVVDCANVYNRYVNPKLCMHHVCKTDKWNRCKGRSYPKVKIFKPMTGNNNEERAIIRDQNINRDGLTLGNLGRLIEKYGPYEDSKHPGWHYYWPRIARSGQPYPILDIDISTEKAKQFLSMRKSIQIKTKYVAIVCGNDNFGSMRFQKLVLDFSNYIGITFFYNKDCQLSNWDIEDQHGLRLYRRDHSTMVRIYQDCHKVGTISSMGLHDYLTSFPGVRRGIKEPDYYREGVRNPYYC